VLEELRSHGVDVSWVYEDPAAPTGVYFKDPGEHATAVHYYRSGSAASRMSPADLERIPLDTAELVHISGITAALSESCLRLLEAILDHPARIRVSFDVNYRPALWKQRNPHEIMSKLLQHCDVVMGNIWSAHDLLGIPLDHALLQKNEPSSYRHHAHQSAMKLLRRFARVKTVAFTFRFEEGEKGILYYASLYSAHHWAESPVYRSDEILDKVGTGDCFMAGLIYGLSKGLTEKETILFASSAGFGKFFETGDSTGQDVQTIQNRIQQYA